MFRFHGAFQRHCGVFGEWLPGRTKVDAETIT